MGLPDLLRHGRLLQYRKKLFFLFLYMLACFMLTLTYHTNNSLEKTMTGIPNRTIMYENYCIHANVFEPKNLEHKEKITQVLHISSNLVDNRIIEQIKNWNAPVSLTIVLINKAEYYCTIQKIKTLLQISPEIVEFLRVHFLFPSAWNSLCQKPEVETKCEKLKYTAKDIITYPINIARNVARMFTSTEYILIADFEHLFSEKFEEEIRQVAKEHLTKGNRRVLVYRIFEIEKNFDDPKTLQELKRLFEIKQAVVFHNRFYKGAHDIPMLKEWFGYNNSTGPIFLQNVKYDKYNWEPQFVSRNDIPFHDIHFPFLIRDNTVLRWELCRAGYKYDVLAKHFMYHRGIKKSRGFMLPPNLQSINYTRFKVALHNFERRMNETYPKTATNCPRFRA